MEIVRCLWTNFSLVFSIINLQYFVDNGATRDNSLNKHISCRHSMRPIAYYIEDGAYISKIMLR